MKFQPTHTPRLLLAAATLLVATGSALAQDKYPSRPIQIVIGYNPGSQDNFIRPFQEKLSEHFKQPIVFVYRPGAGGGVGAASVARAKPDGYTLFVSSAGPMILNPLSNDQLDYKFGDFVPMSRVASVPLGLSVRASSPFKSVKDVIDAARKNPGKITFSTSGPFSTPHLMMQLFERTAGISLAHIPYNGTAPAVVALMGGHVDMAGSPLSGVAAFHKAGTARILAVGTSRRTPDHADVPTFTETGNRVVFGAWHGFFAPRGTPQEVITTFSTALEKVVQDNRKFFEDRMRTLSGLLDFAGQAEFTRDVNDEYNALKEIVPDMIKAAKAAEKK